jgi:hypothetical protein
MKTLEKDDIRYALHSSGQRIELEPQPDQPAAPRRKAFKVQFIKFPVWWIEALRGASGNAHTLAQEIRVEGFKRQNIGGEIVVSSSTSALPRASRCRAVRELERRGLIRTEQAGQQAFRVTIIEASQNGDATVSK